jgi:hypothetical protein
VYFDAAYDHHHQADITHSSSAPGHLGGRYSVPGQADPVS